MSRRPRRTPDARHRDATRRGGSGGCRAGSEPRAEPRLDAGPEVLATEVDLPGRLGEARALDQEARLVAHLAGQAGAGDRREHDPVATPGGMAAEELFELFQFGGEGRGGMVQ